MNRLSLFSTFSIFILTLFLFASGCKKDSADQSSGDSDGAFEIFQIMQTINTEFVRIGGEGNLHPFVALENMIAFAESLEGVAEVYSLDSAYLNVTTLSGYSSYLYLDEVDENGLSLYRGSKNGTSSLNKFTSAMNDCANKIENKKVLLFAAYEEDFYDGNEYQTQVYNLIHNSKLKPVVIVKKNRECTLDLMKTFNQYGLVVLDTHGMKDGVLVGPRFDLIPAEIPGSVTAFEQMLGTKMGPENFALFKAKQLSLGSSYKYHPSLEREEFWRRIKETFSKHQYQLVITSKGIRDLIPDLDNTVVFANTCYSGFNATSYEPPSGKSFSIDPVQPAWMSKNPIAYYGYEAANNGVSYSVDDKHCKKSADTLYRSLFYDNDNTGTAHLYSGTTLSEVPWTERDYRWNEGNLQFKQYGHEDYCYVVCENDNDPFVTATIIGLPSGNSFVASSTNNSNRNDSTVNLQAQQSSRLLNLSTTVYTGVGTYTVGGPYADWRGSYKPSILTQYVSIDSSPGQITITDDCETYIEGTFNFPVQDANGVELQVTSGDFLIFY